MLPLIKEFGRNTLSYHLLNPDIQVWHSKNRRAVIGYVLVRNTCVVIGEPVCPQDDLKTVMTEFQGSIEKSGHSLCYLGVEEQSLSEFDGSILMIGEQPCWVVKSFLDKFWQKKSLRAQYHRAENKNIETELHDSLDKATIEELKICLEKWLGSHGLPPLHLTVEPDVFHWFHERRCLIARHKGQILGYVIVTPIRASKRWYVEHIIRDPEAPNGTAELMLYHAVKSLQTNDTVTLGMSPLARHKKFEVRHRHVRYALNWMRAHGRRFYDFQGLDFFKTKFLPDYWEDVYLVDCHARLRQRTLWAVLEALAQKPFLKFLKDSFYHAIRQEWFWLRTKWRR